MVEEGILFSTTIEQEEIVFNLEDEVVLRWGVFLGYRIRKS